MTSVPPPSTPENDPIERKTPLSQERGRKKVQAAMVAQEHVNQRRGRDVAQHDSIGDGGKTIVCEPVTKGVGGLLSGSGKESYALIYRLW